MRFLRWLHRAIRNWLWWVAFVATVLALCTWIFGTTTGPKIAFIAIPSIVGLLVFINILDGWLEWREGRK